MEIDNIEQDFFDAFLTDACHPTSLHCYSSSSQLVSGIFHVLTSPVVIEVAEALGRCRSEAAFVALETGSRISFQESFTRNIIGLVRLLGIDGRMKL